MSEDLVIVIRTAIEQYLEKNGYLTITPNLLTEEIQKELSIFIESEIAKYIGRSR